MAAKKPTNIQAYKRKWHMNIGIIVFGAIFIYLIITVFLYIAKPKVSIYEVREGSILRDRSYTGFVVRDEEIIKAESSGYINYLVPESDKVGKKTRVYSISAEALKFEKNSKKKSKKLSSDEQHTVITKAQTFCENFNEGQFDDVYALKTDISNILENKSNQSKKSQLNEMLKSKVEGLNVFYAATDGIIVYSTDGYEDITVDKVKEKDLSKKDYNKVNMSDNTAVQKGDAAYKLIKDNHWSIVIQLSDAAAKEMAEIKRIKVRFLKDNQTATASFSTKKLDGIPVGILEFSSSMVRYAQERYLDIELILDDESGLKIPKSAVVKKEFYVVPEDYLTQGGNSKETGVLLETGRSNPEFVPVDVYFRDNETGMVYLDPNAFKKKIILIKPNSTETYQLGETKNLNGVYNINKGYAVFKQIQILCESDEYYIVVAGNDYGLANYDHIALDGKIVKENDVVF